MYLGIDVGGTKTLVTSLTNEGVIKEEFKFPTPQDYNQFPAEVRAHTQQLSTDDFRACGIGIPGIVDKHGHGRDFGHLPWHNVAIQADIEKLAQCPVVVENDAKLAGLSEAMLVKHHQRVLYITVSTGIGIGYIVDQHIDPYLRTNEGGFIMIEHRGKYKHWEDFASGSAIVKQFGRPLKDIHSERDLRTIARNIAIGLISHIAILTPDIIVIGGSVGTFFPKYGTYLVEYLRQYDNPMIQLPIVQAAQRPEKAVVYGCYDLAKQLYP